MVLDPQNLNYLLGFLGLIGVLFTVYNKFNDPQKAMDKRQALTEQEVDGKASMIAQRVQWERESVDKRFAELSARIVESTALAQNHIHTIDTKVDALSNSVNEARGELIKLGTIINERIPVREKTSV